MHIIENLYEQFLLSTGVSIDTRTLKSGNIYFALKGPNFNANAFATRALDQGATLVVIDDEKYAVSGKTIQVDDVLATLQALATHHRHQMDIPVIGITGSNGKTTTKELIFRVLNQKFNVRATIGNLNNHIGVPLTLLDLNKSIEIAIIEMGANHVGEIAALCEIARPTHALITNIGKAHIGTFGGMEGIIKGKTELYEYIRNHNGTVFVNQRQEILMEKSHGITSRYLYPEADGFYSGSLVKADPFLHIRAENKRIINTQLIGKYNFDNAVAALCIGKYFDVVAEDAALAIESYLPESNRSQIVQRDDINIVLDAYNANPSSMASALDNLKDMRVDKKAVILGDMYELGQDAESEHRLIGSMLAKMGFEKNIFCGALMKHAATLCPGGLYFENKEELIDYLKHQRFPGFTILIKGSRGMALEDVLPHIQ